MVDSDFAPNALDLFATRHVYSGQGRAEFSSPLGILEGPIQVEFDDRGKSMATLTIDNYIPMHEPARLLVMFFVSDEPILDPETGNLSQAEGLDSVPNECLSLKLETPQGAFVAESPLPFSTGFQFLATKVQITLTF